MSPEAIVDRFRVLARTHLPRPGVGRTPERHHAIFEAGREDLSLAKLIEAHWDAVAILEEAGREPVEGNTYAVWASEVPGRPLRLQDGVLHGIKEFCSGAPLVDRALVAAGDVLVEVDLQASRAHLHMDESGWLTEAFRPTRTAAITFDACPIAAVLGRDGWYTRRTGFWQGACGPAAAWAGGAAGLLDWALASRRDDPHTLAHLGAMHSAVSAMRAVLRMAGEAFDHAPEAEAMVPALAVRHTVEQLSTDVLRRFGRAFGPAPLVKDAGAVRRFAELELFLRQCHAERDLEGLGGALRAQSAQPRGA